MPKFLLLFVFITFINSVYSQPVTTEAVPVQHMYTEQSRPKEKIQEIFPYDIWLRTPEGDSILSSKVFAKGKPVVLLFWLTTCYPCKIEMDAIASKFNTWKKETDFELYAISTDFAHNFSAIQKRANDKNWPFKFYWDYNREFKEILPGGLNGLPQSFILDKTGQIAYHKRKYSSGDEDIMYEEIKLLASKK